MTGRQSRKVRVACSLGLAVAGGVVPGPRAAAAQKVAPLQGTFVWDSTAGDYAAGAVEAALGDVNFLTAGSRRHLQRGSEPYRTVTIEHDEATISIATDSGEPIRAPAGGEPIEWTRADGKRMRVSIAWKDGAIRQTFMSEDEERENLFRPNADGRAMIMAVTVRMDRLPDPMRYELVYRKTEDSRMRQYLWDVAGPRPLVGTFLVAGVDQLLDVPEEWDRNLGGYARRAASRWGRFAIQTTVTHGLAAALDRPTDYLPCECSGYGQRVPHALLGTITDPAAEGGRTLALPRIAGIYAGAFAELAFTPANADAGDALMSGTSRIMVSAIGNLVREFLGARIPLTHGPGM